MKLPSILSISTSSALAVAVSFTAMTSPISAKSPEQPTDAPAETKIKISPEEMRKEISYGLGFQNGEQYASHGFMVSDLDKEAYLRGLLEALEQKDYASDPKTFDDSMRAFDKVVSNREAELAKTNALKEEAFLEKNGKREGVVTTKSGLQYEILLKANGKTYTLPEGATEGADMQTEFLVFTRTTLIDGTLLNENTTEKPERYSLEVIEGLAEALKIMPIGSKWKLYVPSKLAFGNRRFGAKVGPNSVIVYEIELKDIVVKKAPPKDIQR